MSDLIPTPWKVVYLGIDPGNHGGLAAIQVPREGKPTNSAITMPPTLGGVWEWFLRFTDFSCPVHACLEKVGGYVGGDEGQSGMGPSMFTFGKGYGSLEAILHCPLLGVRLEECVTPQVWEREFSIIPRRSHTEETQAYVDEKGRRVAKSKKKVYDEPKSAHKNRIKDRAEQLFPELRLNLNTADACLIAEWCRRKVEGRLTKGVQLVREPRR